MMNKVEITSVPRPATCKAAGMMVDAALPGAEDFISLVDQPAVDAPDAGLATVQKTRFNVVQPEPAAIKPETSNRPAPRSTAHHLMHHAATEMPADAIFPQPWPKVEGKPSPAPDPILIPAKQTLPTTDSNPTDPVLMPDLQLQAFPPPTGKADTARSDCERSWDTAAPTQRADVPPPPDRKASGPVQNPAEHGASLPPVVAADLSKAQGPTSVQPPPSPSSLSATPPLDAPLTPASLAYAPAAPTLIAASSQQKPSDSIAVRPITPADAKTRPATIAASGRATTSATLPTGQATDLASPARSKPAASIATDRAGLPSLNQETAHRTPLRFSPQTPAAPASDGNSVVADLTPSAPPSELSSKAAGVLQSFEPIALAASTPSIADLKVANGTPEATATPAEPAFRAALPDPNSAQGTPPPPSLRTLNNPLLRADAAGLVLQPATAHRVAAGQPIPVGLGDRIHPDGTPGQQATVTVGLNHFSQTPNAAQPANGFFAATPGSRQPLSTDEVKATFLRVQPNPAPPEAEAAAPPTPKPEPLATKLNAPEVRRYLQPLSGSTAALPGQSTTSHGILTPAQALSRFQHMLDSTNSGITAQRPPSFAPGLNVAEPTPMAAALPLADALQPSINSSQLATAAPQIAHPKPTMPPLRPEVAQSPVPPPLNEFHSAWAAPRPAAKTAPVAAPTAATVAAASDTVTPASVLADTSPINLKPHTLTTALDGTRDAFARAADLMSSSLGPAEPALTPLHAEDSSAKTPGLIAARVVDRPPPATSRPKDFRPEPGAQAGASHSGGTLDNAARPKPLPNAAKPDPVIIFPVIPNPSAPSPVVAAAPTAIPTNLAVTEAKPLSTFTMPAPTTSQTGAPIRSELLPAAVMPAAEMPAPDMPAAVIPAAVISATSAPAAIVRAADVPAAVMPAADMPTRPLAPHGDTTKGPRRTGPVAKHQTDPFIQTMRAAPVSQPLPIVHMPPLDAAPHTSPIPAPDHTSHALPKGFPASLAHSVTDSGHARAELILEPAELGRMRFDLVTEGDQVQITLTAERPETLELLRRHADELRQEFRAAGLDTGTLSFSQWGQKGHSHTRADPSMDPIPEDLPLAPPPPSAPQPRAIGAALNLRL